MKLRLIEHRKKRFLLCPNGSIMKADKEVVNRLLTDFKRAGSFKGNYGYWNTGGLSMEDVYGVTLAFVDNCNHLIIVSENLFAQ